MLAAPAPATDMSSSSDERRPRDRRTGATPSHAAVTYRRCSGQQQRPLPPFPSVGRLVEKYTMLIERHRQRQNGLTPTGRRKSPSPQPTTTPPTTTPPQPTTPPTTPQPTTPSPEDADGATVAGPPVDDPAVAAAAAVAAWSLMDDDDADADDGDCDEDDADEDDDDCDGDDDDNGDDRRRRRRRRRSRQIGSCGGGVLLPGKWRRRNVSRAGGRGWEELVAGHHVVSRGPTSSTCTVRPGVPNYYPLRVSLQPTMRRILY